MSEIIELPPQENSDDALQPVGKLRIGIIGDNYLADATRASFDRNLVDVVQGDMEEILKATNIVYICEDLPLLKNNTADDAELLDLFARIYKESDSGICLKTTITNETLDRIIGVTDAQWFLGKVIYSPEVAETALEVLNGDTLMIGGDEKTVDAHTNIIMNNTILGAKKVLVGTHHEIVYAKLAIVGFKAVKQTFFNQMYQTIIDCEGANPAKVRRLIESSDVMQDTSLSIPTFIKAGLDAEITAKDARSFGGEFANSDVRMLIGMTDRLTVLDECFNIRNIK
tara:strand:- start:175 stop:1026 length:852 start_codon:yes stop_codon:yes gene_type:complete